MFLIGNPVRLLFLLALQAKTSRFLETQLGKVFISQTREVGDSMILKEQTSKVATPYLLPTLIW